VHSSDLVEFSSPEENLYLKEMAELCQSTHRVELTCPSHRGWLTRHQRRSDSEGAGHATSPVAHATHATSTPLASVAKSWLCLTRAGRLFSS